MRSDIDNLCNVFIAALTNAGYALKNIENYKQISNRFKRFCTENGYDTYTVNIGQMFADNVFNEKTGEVVGYRHVMYGRFVRLINSFYLHGTFDFSMVESPVPRNSYRPEVYLLSDSEIQRFFKECDSYVLQKKIPGRPYVYPALYRFLYCCGARCGEARHLRCENVHLNDGYLDILQSKGHRDRRLFLSDELISYLIDYDSAIRDCFPEREYFFPGPSGNIISASSVPFNFRKIWLAAGLKRDGGIKPRPYDFRHHFACANIARWSKDGKDVISMLPYLMRYMGHSSLEKTYYYVHLIPDYFANYAAATENLESLLPEVEPYEI